MKKKELSAAFTLILLFSAVAATQFVSLGVGNPYSFLNVVYGGYRAAPPNTKPPSITIDNILNSGSNTSINFSVRIGESGTADNVSSMIITSVYYEADWQGNNAYVYEYIPNPSDSSNAKTEFSTILDLNEIPEGRHTLLIYATERGSYYDINPSNWPMFGTVYYYGFNKTGSSTVNFTIDITPPDVSILLEENKTYRTTDVRLNFTVSESTSQITYSLDRQENVTILGNTTLTDLSVGKHNLTVYATDMHGNTALETIAFTVAESEPFPTTLVMSSIASVAVIVAGLLVYFRKHNH